MAAFGLLPEEPRQALRIRRHLIAAGTSSLVALVLFAGYWVDLLALSAAVEGAAVIVALVASFHVIFRSGLNLRFADPSLTTPQIGAAILFLAWMMYRAPAARESLSLFYLVAMLFGVLRLNTVRLMALALLALTAHTALVLLSFVRDPLMDLRAAYVQLAVLFIVLPWFAFMGGFVNSLRQRLSDSNRQLQEAVDRIGEIAIRDELTGVYNRRFLMETLQREASRAARLGTPLSVCLFDLDHFKDVNDSYGHAAGDAVLRRFTEIARTGLRGVDVLGRHGGEEFLLVLPDTDLAGALGCAERIRANVAREDFPAVPPSHRITVTSGAACATMPETADTLLARADRALYRGKQTGRDRVVAG